jgi:hypothetical protein
MTTRMRLIGLVAGLLPLAGCAAGDAPAPSAAAAPARSVPATVQSPGYSPAAAAQAICSEAVGSQIQQVLGLDAVPAPESASADNRYTCTYQTPMGPMVFSVSVEPTPAAAAEQLEILRTRHHATSPVAALDQAYSNGLGAVIALEDALVLLVDAAELPPEHLGPDHLSQTGVAIKLAKAVLDGWTGPN